jgi:branched-chain amino acid transport system substrate-binding protein
MKRPRSGTFRSWEAGLWVILFSGMAASAGSLPIRIGLLLPPDEAEADSVRHGVELAVEHACQPERRPVGLIVRGRTGQWGDDGVEAARMVLDDGAQGLLAPPDGGASHLTLQVAGRTAVPVISLCGDSSITAAGIPWSARIVPSTRDEAGALFKGLRAMRGAGAWVAFIPGDRAGREVARDLIAAARSAGVELAQPIEVADGISDFSTLYPVLPKEWPDGVLLWLDSESAGHMTKYLRTIGFKGTLSGPGRLDSGAFREAAGSAMEGFVLPVLGTEGKGEGVAAQFGKSYWTRHGRSPDASAAMAYDGARLLIELLRRAGEDQAHEWFPLDSIPPGVTGPLSFDRDGNRIVSLRLAGYHRGDLAPLASRDDL